MLLEHHENTQIMGYKAKTICYWSIMKTQRSWDIKLKQYATGAS